MLQYRRRPTKGQPASLKRASIITLASSSIAVWMVMAAPVSEPSSAATRAATSIAESAISPHAATTTTTIATVVSTRVVPEAPITTGASRSECIAPNTSTTNYGLSYLQSQVTTFDTETDSSVTCLSAYLQGSQTWSQWEHPWITDSMYGFTPWVAESPQTRQLVLQENLIPKNLEDVNDPLKWEKSCAAGDYKGHATQLGASLVAAGLANSVIRLGSEGNGTWEADFMGTRKVEQNLWARCFASEVTGLRRATGEHFLIDWNPNACVGNYPYANYYPGNAYVDILGLDLYDVGCLTPTTSLTFSQLANEPAGLTLFERFANAKGKPMSFPEWGLSTIPSGDDPGYIDGIGSVVAKGDFAFETYFDAVGIHTKALPLGSRTPRSLAAFRTWFGSATNQ